MTVNNQTYLWTRPLKYTPSPIRFFRISPHQNHSVSTKPIIAYSFHVVFTTPLHKTCNRKRYVSTSIHRLYRHTRIVYKYHYLGNRSIYIYISTRYFSTFAFAIDRIGYYTFNMSYHFPSTLSSIAYTDWRPTLRHHRSDACICLYALRPSISTYVYI